MKHKADSGLPRSQDKPEGGSKKRKESFIFSEIAELERPFQIILEKLKSRIENGEYGLVVGDDASGRIPALVMSRFLNKVNKEKGLDNVATKFFAGGGSFSKHLKVQKKGKEIPDTTVEIAVSLMKSDLPKVNKVLVVTDSMVTGRSLKPILGALRASGVSYDIVSVGLDPALADHAIENFDASKDDDVEKFAEFLGKQLGGEVIFGLVGTPNVYFGHSLSGVMKRPGDLYATPLRKVDQDYPTGITGEEKEFDLKSVPDARNDVDLLTNRLYEYFKQTA
jgi:adenine/guanine phosphoribosyltransferase-like PRPP-binding protein